MNTKLFLRISYCTKMAVQCLERGEKVKICRENTAYINPSSKDF